MDQIELDHVSQVIGYHPSYLEHFLKIQTFIMQGDGPLPYDYRHYLAIMVSLSDSDSIFVQSRRRRHHHYHRIIESDAICVLFVAFLQAAARHQCTYLVNLHEKEFLEQRGDPNWLKGLEYIPPKLRAIYDINKILAHRPWLLNKEHIEVSVSTHVRMFLSQFSNAKNIFVSLLPFFCAIIYTAFDQRSTQLVNVRISACHRTPISFSCIIIVCILMWPDPTVGTQF